YVRDRMTVEVALGDGDTHEIGDVEPIAFDTSLEVFIAMPGLMPMKAGAPPNVGDPPFDGEPDFDDLLNDLGEQDLTLGYDGETTTYNETGPLKKED
ncbi:hypothetical protein, partial [Natronolimnohabitans innermongolicus]